MFSFKDSVEKYKPMIKKYALDFIEKNRVESYSGTWLHKVGFVLHFIIFKIQALFNFYSFSVKKATTNADYGLAKDLNTKLDLYKSLTPKHQDQFGFVHTDRCDSTLYSGLLGSVGVKVNIRAAKNNHGYWERRPLIPCYKNGSKSSFSRDMLIGLLWWIWRNRDLELAEELYNHFRKNNFVMGLGDPSRLLVMNGLEATLAEIIFQLGGKNRWLARRQLQTWPKGLTGYELHLSMLHMLLINELKGGITKKMLKSIEHYGKDSCFAIVQYVYAMFVSGDLNPAIRTLLNSELWPEDRLPNNKDRSADWLHTQDNPNDYIPSDSEEVHEYPGADLIFYASLILNIK